MTKQAWNDSIQISGWPPFGSFLVAFLIVQSRSLHPTGRSPQKQHGQPRVQRSASKGTLLGLGVGVVRNAGEQRGSMENRREGKDGIWPPTLVSDVMVRCKPHILDIGEPLSKCEIASMAGNAPAMRNARVAGGIPRRSFQVSTVWRHCPHDDSLTR
mgnify:CR=1 FL=1